MNPWDNDPIVQGAPPPLTVTPAGANPWDTDPIVAPAQSAGDSSAAVGRGLIKGAKTAPAGPSAVRGALTFDDVPMASARPLTVHGSAPVAAPSDDGLGAQDDGGLAAMMAFPGYVNNVVRQAANAVPVLGGLANRLDAATAAASGQGSYAANLAAQDRQDQQFAADHPMTAGVAGLAGGAGGAAAILPAEGLGLVGGMGQRLVGSAIGGGALGAADSAVRGQDVPTGAVLGAGMGLAGPVLGAGAGAAGRAAAGAMKPAPEALQGAGRIGVRWLRNAVGDATPEDIAAAQARLGPHGFTGELTPGLLDLSGSIADANGTGKAVIRGAYADRQGGTDTRVNALVDQTLGPHDTTALQYSKGLLDQAAQLGQERAKMLADWQGPRPDISPVVEQINAQIPSTAENSPQRAALLKALSMVQERAKPVAPQWEPVFDAEPVGEPPEPIPPGDNPEDMIHGTYTKPKRPDMPRPQDARSVIRSLGGVRDANGDLAASGVDQVPGAGKLIRAPGSGKGVSADQAAETLAQLGYFGADTTEAMRSRNTDMLADALVNHPAYPEGPARDAWRGYDQDLADWNRWKSDTAGQQRYKPVMPAKAPMSLFDPGLPDLTVRGPGHVPVSDPMQLHGLKQAFDAEINYDATGLQPSNPVVAAQQGGYRDFRGGINDALRSTIPDYGPNQDLTAALMRQQRQVREGTIDLDRTQNPADYAPMVQGLSPEEIAARKVGNRETVASSLGKSGNDFLALKNKLQGLSADGEPMENGGWNLRNLGALFGQDAAEGLNTGLNQEAQMRTNTQRIAGGSPTGEKVQRSQITQPDPQGGLLGYWNKFYIDKPSTWLPVSPEKMAEGMRGKAYEAARANVAPLLVQQGEGGSKLIDALMQLQQQKAMLDHVGQPTDALVRALVAAGAQPARRQLQAN